MLHLLIVVWFRMSANEFMEISPISFLQGLVYLLLFCDLWFILIWLEFKQDDKYESIWILLHTDIQSEQHHALMMLYFSSVYLWLLYKNSDSIGVWLCQWVFNSLHWSQCVCFMPIPNCFCYHSFVAYVKIRTSDISNRTFIPQGCFRYCLYVCVCVTYEAENSLFKICEVFWQRLHWICILFC